MFPITPPERNDNAIISKENPAQNDVPYKSPWQALEERAHGNSDYYPREKYMKPEQYASRPEYSPAVRQPAEQTATNIVWKDLEDKAKAVRQPAEQTAPNNIVWKDVEDKTEAVRQPAAQLDREKYMKPEQDASRPEYYPRENT